MAKNPLISYTKCDKKILIYISIRKKSGQMAREYFRRSFMSIIERCINDKLFLGINIVLVLITRGLWGIVLGLSYLKYGGIS